MNNIAWHSTLKKVLELVRDFVNEDAAVNFQSMIIGSSATALQGCNVPNDIDILTVEPAGVYRFAGLPKHLCTCIA